MKIIVDAMGGDNAPAAIVQGALEASRLHGVEIILVGRAAEILRAVEACGEKTLPSGVEIRDASEVVEIEDDPATAFKRKKDSSLTVGLTLLRGRGRCLRLRRLHGGPAGRGHAGGQADPGHPAGRHGPSAAHRHGKDASLCDCGANAECTPEYLLQFAYLGSYYAKRVLGIETPRVALLNIGAEASKGDALRHEAYTVLKEAGDAGRIHFVGNLEASEAMMGGADVVVADGFSGNIMLKSLEGTAKFLMKELKKMFLSSTKTKLAAGLVKGDLAELKKLLDPSEVGGTPFLGISRPVIKAHGSSDAKAICNAVLRAKEYAESGFIADVERDVALMKVERTAENV